MNKFEQRLSRDGAIIVDGGLATQLESMGHDIGSTLWSAALLESNPRVIVEAHRAYLDAGADCIISASYQASRKGFMSLGHSAAEADNLIGSAVRLAQKARREFLARNDPDDEPLVAASVGPYGAALHDGSEYSGAYDASADEIRSFHESRLEILDAAGADLLAVETIPDFDEASILAELLQQVHTPAWISFSCRDEIHVSDGTPLRAVAALFADHPRVLAIGINCTPPQLITPLIAEIRAAAPGKAIVVYPNSGETYHVDDNSWSGTACDFDADFNVKEWYKAGAKLIGGCCRTGPAHTAEIRRRLRAAL